METIHLKVNDQELVIAPKIGGSILSWTFKGKDILRGVKNPNLKAQQNTAVGAYPLIPYSNRINKGHFTFGGKSYTIAPNMEGCPHSIHGNAWELPWRVEHQTDDSVVLVLDSDPKSASGAGWPFKYRATLSYRLSKKGLKVRIVVENRDKLEQPIGFGFHPFFAVSKNAEVKFEAPEVWTNNKAGLPDKLIATEGEWDFSKPRDIAPLVIDNCFSCYSGICTIRDHEAGYTVHIQSDPIFEHVLIFHPKKADFLAVEPVTNQTNAINGQPPYAGLHVLKPEQRLGGDIHFEVETFAK